MMPKHLLSSQGMVIKEQDHTKKVIMANNFKIAGIFKTFLYFQDSFSWAVPVLSRTFSSVKVILPYQRK